MAYEVEMHPLSRMSPYISVMSVITVMVARQRLTYAVYSMTMNCKGSLKVMHPSLLRRETVPGAGSLRSAKATKSDAGVKFEAVYLFPNISPCSYRDRRPARP